jgi:proline iminopeptidase
MGCDRAGFYSWDRLDNGGRPSAKRVHPEWQDLEQEGASARYRAVKHGGVSPFHHLAFVPGDSIDVGSSIVKTGKGVAAAAAGIAGCNRRDIVGA